MWYSRARRVPGSGLALSVSGLIVFGRVRPSAADPSATARGRDPDCGEPGRGVQRLADDGPREQAGVDGDGEVVDRRAGPPVVAGQSCEADVGQRLTDAGDAAQDEEER